MVIFMSMKNDSINQVGKDIKAIVDSSSRKKREKEEFKFEFIAKHKNVLGQVRVPQQQPTLLQNLYSAINQWEQIVFQLKLGLDSLEMPLVYELLDRSYNNPFMNIEAISDEDTIRLSRDLGYLSPKDASVLLGFRETADKVLHLDNKKSTSNDYAVIYSFILEKDWLYKQYLIKYDSLVSDRFPMFESLRAWIASGEKLSDKDTYLIDIRRKPYAAKRLALRLILGMVKSSSGTMLDNVLTNAQVIIPYLWEKLSMPDRFQVGRCYSDLVIDGRTTAAEGLKRLLFKVQGLDYVTDSYRASFYSVAADAILDAHFGKHGFYTEYKPVEYMHRLGPEIPKSVLSKCLTALLCVELGSVSGISPKTKESADAILGSISLDKWVYYFNDCILYEERIIDLLRQKNYATSWLDLRIQFSFDQCVEMVSKPLIKYLLESTNEDDVTLIASKSYYRLVGKFR